MIDAMVLGPLGLAITLIFSGVLKIKDQDSTRSVVVELRLPMIFRHPAFATVFPWAEVLLGMLLLTPWGPVTLLAAILTTVLFLLYFVVIARAMTFTPRPSCGCFGRIGNHRVSGATLVRNGVFVVLSGFGLVLASTGNTVPSVLWGSQAAPWWVLGTLLLCTAVALIASGSAEEPGPTPVERSPEARDAGNEGVRPIPAGLLVTAEGQVHTLRDLAALRPQLLVAFNCLCMPSYLAVSRVEEWQERIPGVDVRIMTTVPLQELCRAMPVADPLYDHQGLSWNALGMTGSPSAVLLGADGTVVGEPVQEVDEIDAFVTDIAEVLADADQDG